MHIYVFCSASIFQSLLIFHGLLYQHGVKLSPIGFGLPLWLEKLEWLENALCFFEKKLEKLENYILFTVSTAG